MSFRQVQESFIDYIRDPSRPLPVDTDARRMSVYRELFFNNVEGFVSNAFPVLKSLYGRDNWLALVQQFFVTHDCQTPIFVEIAAEFLDFLINEYEANADDPAFILELAHYEYLELQVAVAQESESCQRLELITEDDKLVMSQCARVAQYAYEVQHISADYQPLEPASGPQCFCVYRDDDDDVQFLALAPLTAQVLSMLASADGMTLSGITAWCKSAFPQVQADAIEQGILPLLTQMAQKGIIRVSIA